MHSPGPPPLPLQYNCYLRNVNKVALFRRVVDRQELKASGRAGLPHHPWFAHGPGCWFECRICCSAG